MSKVPITTAADDILIYFSEWRKSDILYELSARQTICMKYENISENTQEKPQSRLTALPRHKKKERWGINNDKTTDAQTK